MIKRLIFDVDGTLITNVNFNDAVKRTLIKINAYSKENFNSFLNGINTYENKFNNYNIKDYTQHISSAINKNLSEEFLNIFFEELKNAIPNENVGLIKTIKELSEVYELVLLTNYFSRSQMNRLNNMGIGQFFRECYGEKLIKPNIDSYINACGKYLPSECVIIGDDLKLDIEEAQKVGLNTIFVNNKNIENYNVKTIEVEKIEEINTKLINSIKGEYNGKSENMCK